ncbi:MAG: alpha amylase C-terminal domain-containing protein, partial [Clostridia bacterium]|nr:alpha amylase C-terminal domain-containing protein [Clostridia bacterium]
ITSFIRWDDSKNGIVCVTNFTPAYYPDYVIGLPGYGYIKEVLNTDSAAFGGSGKGNPKSLRAHRKAMGDCKWSCSIVVPPLATVFFTYTRPLTRGK